MFKILDVKDVAVICNHTESDVIEWIEKGVLPAFKGKQDDGHYINEQDLKNFMNSDEYNGSKICSKRIKHEFMKAPDAECCWPINLLICIMKDTSEDADIWKQDIGKFEQMIELLKDREKRVIHMYYEYGMTLDDIGSALGGLTKERARQIREKAKEKLKRWIEWGKCKMIPQEEYDQLMQQFVALHKENELLKLNDKNEHEEFHSITTHTPTVYLEDMRLSEYTYRCLLHNNFKTLDDLIAFDQQQARFYPSWKMFSNLGEKTLVEIAEKVYSCSGYRIHIYSWHEKKFIEVDIGLQQG